MAASLFQAIVNFLAVSGGLYVLWSAISRMPAGKRAKWAVTAGTVSGVVTFLVAALAQAVA